MERNTILIFALAAMVVALIWMGWNDKDFMGIFVSLLAGAGVTVLANKIELKRRRQ